MFQKDFHKSVFLSVFLLTVFILSVSAHAETFTAISSGGNFTCVLTDSGGVKCWGVNYEGQLGDGTNTPRLIAASATILSGSPVSTIDVSGYHACVLTNGVMQCWGRNNFGQLGMLQPTSSLTPVTINLSGVRAITEGAEHTCASIGSVVLCHFYIA